MNTLNMRIMDRGMKILPRVLLAGLLAMMITGSCGGGGVPAGGVVSGRVVRQDGAGLAGVVISAVSDIFDPNSGGCGSTSTVFTTTTTDDDGYYSFYIGDRSGTSSLAPSMDGYVFNPSSRQVAGSSSSAVTGQDFTATLSTGATSSATPAAAGMTDAPAVPGSAGEATGRPAADDRFVDNGVL